MAIEWFARLGIPGEPGEVPEGLRVRPAVAVETVSDTINNERSPYEPYSNLFLKLTHNEVYPWKNVEAPALAYKKFSIRYAAPPLPYPPAMGRDHSV
jgi:hypothetical protein